MLTHHFTHYLFFRLILISLFCFTASTVLAEEDTPPAPASAITVQGEEVRAWDQTKKEMILNQVKPFVLIETSEDMELFATGVVLNNDIVKNITADEAGVSVTLPVPAKLFGLFSTAITQEITLRFDRTARGEVEITYPWYHKLYKVEPTYTIESVRKVVLPPADAVVPDESGLVLTPQDQANVLARLMFALELE